MCLEEKFTFVEGCTKRNRKCVIVLAAVAISLRNRALVMGIES
jgi:hypothetical protein